LVSSKQLRNRIAGYIAKARQQEAPEDAPTSGEPMKE